MARLILAGSQPQGVIHMPDTTTFDLPISGMTCASCAGRVERALAKVPGVNSVTVNLANESAHVDTAAHTDPQTLIDAVSRAGYGATLSQDRHAEADQKARHLHHERWALLLAILLALPLILPMLLTPLGVHWMLPAWVQFALATPVQFILGARFYVAAWKAVRAGAGNMDLLVAIGTSAGYGLSVYQWLHAAPGTTPHLYFEASAVVIALVLLGKYLESRAKRQTASAIRALEALRPERALRVVDGLEQDVAISALQLDDRVLVKPGERFPVDGEVVEGRSHADEALITGESLPVEKTVGDKVFAGTINQAGSLEYRVTAAANNSTLARIIHAVEAAQGSRAPTQRFVDSFSRIYTPVVFVVALALALVAPLFFGGEWYDWIYRALVLLVVACPCALVISTPVTIVSGLAAAARKGILIKGGVYLEMGEKLDYLALDKTGTLTHGKPVQTDYVPLNPAVSDSAPGIAASLAGRSDHPVSQAIAKAADGSLTLYEVSAFEALGGRGVKGEINGQMYHLGNHRLVEELGLCSPELEARLDALEMQGKTVVLLLDASGPIALFAVADTVKETSREAIAQLHELGIKTVMLTGDNPHTAKAIADQVGIDEAQGNLLPADKLSAIEALYSRNHRVGMVGDGINDAPALARAEIGFAMAAAGTDTAIETADVALMDDDLRKIPTFIALSRRTSAVLKQNIVLAIVTKVLFIGITFAGLATMWMAVFADMGVSLLVVFNGLRLLKK
ncbi:Heavy metal--translocating P-type ATPase [Pseudomonas savastanoi pv. phaseolicola]|uniref:Heavy metal--translocating P-type ATPase n=1 Tax=Pseudomonas savastanoi pv. phaseolicola TaxID=319 RepID=A0A7Z6USB0_PSESH|nr:Heavy metal--translocating P-type ATPase [Pseudomonas savastanoi pv. phaseolicola]